MISAVLSPPADFIKSDIDMSGFEAQFANSAETRFNTHVNSVKDLVDPEALSLAFDAAIAEAEAGLNGQSFENGLDPLGNAKAYNRLVQQFGEDSAEAKAQREVLQADMATLLMEEITSTNFFEKNYQVSQQGKIIAAGQNLSEVYARCLAAAGPNTPAWMLERFTAELEEVLSFEQLIASGQAEGKTHITISPTPFKLPEAELERYGLRGLLMIRFMTYDTETQSLNLSQIQLPQDNITEGDLRTLFDELGVKLKSGHLDAATAMLEAGILIDQNYLTDQTDLIKMLDQILERRRRYHLLRRHAFMGSFVMRSAADQDYRKLYSEAEQRYKLQQDVIDQMVEQILALSLTPGVDFNNFAEQAKKMAFAKMSGAEIEQRYGKKIADAYAAGGYDGAKSAGLKDGLSGSCPGSASSSEKDGNNNGENGLFCARLPKPGEVACCPGCKQVVVVTGTEDNIKCSNGACILADAHSRAMYLAAMALKAKLNQESGGTYIWQDEGLGALFFIKKFVSEAKLEMLQQVAEQPEAQQDQFALAA